MKFSDALLDELSNTGYSHCFFVAGGNTMHLLNAARTRFVCVPVINEVTAGIASEYFNKSASDRKKAFALVTAGPGLTNIVTSIAGAYLESRELLVIGGQVKTTDLKNPELRQNGIQEIDGRTLVESITIKSIRLDSASSIAAVQSILTFTGRPGPIFLEIPLDIQAMEVSDEVIEVFPEAPIHVHNSEIDDFISRLLSDLNSSKRPILLLGGGLSREITWLLSERLAELGIPIMTTWNGAELYAANLKNYWGRPNTWGQRSSNILIQQCDLLIAVGTRLGLQQTGFAWEDFCPVGKIFQVDIDPHELRKGHPKIEIGLVGDANLFLGKFLAKAENETYDFHDWINFGEYVLENLPIANENVYEESSYVDPFLFVTELSKKMESNDVLVPCSSGGAFTVTMQAFRSKQGQVITTNKGLASMGYGLAGAIGSAIGSKRRTILIEGDGGFSQNLQELGTVVQQKLNLKIFVFANAGYASIRMTQRNYFDGAYLGCDIETGLGLPNWSLIAQAYGINYTEFSGTNWLNGMLETVLESSLPEFIVINIDPEQTFWPKINSIISENGQMQSNPLHRMHPPLTDQENERFIKYL
jgi:acetolactate synthase-1/2/3 large subunit